MTKPEDNKTLLGYPVRISKEITEKAKVYEEGDKLIFEVPDPAKVDYTISAIPGEGITIIKGIETILLESWEDVLMFEAAIEYLAEFEFGKKKRSRKKRSIT